MTEQEKSPRKKLSLTTLTVLSMIAGLAWGLFLGEYGSWLKWIGDAYVGLLQMTVFPYVAVSLVANVGRLELGQGIKLARASGFVFVLLWGIGLVTLMITANCYPPWETGSFYSSSHVESGEAPNWLPLFVPSNPFRSLAEGMVPAIVVFSIGLGVALMGIPNKETLLDQLDVLVNSLAGLNRLVIKLSPVGIFAIMGHSSATMSFEQFGLVQGYLLVHASAAVILTFWLVPSVIACCTPFSYRECLSASRDALITAFVIGNTFVVLPMIVEGTKTLVAKHKPEMLHPDSSPEYAVQLAYPFPDLGRIVGLIFIPFAAWFYGTTIDPSRVPSLVGVGTVGAFAKPVVTIPMLLDLAELPGDIFNLFIAVGVIAARFGDLMKTIHLFAFGILTASVLSGVFKVNWGRLARFGILTAIIFGSLIVGSRLFLENSFKGAYDKDELLTARTLINKQVDATLLTSSEPNPEPRLDGEDTFARIQRTGTLRVGIRPDNVPFSYINKEGDLVGFDVDMAHKLAWDLKVNLEFIPTEADFFADEEADHFDIAMSGFEGTIKRATLLPFTRSYLQISAAIVVPDQDRNQFQSLEQVIEHEDLRIAVISHSKAKEAISEREELVVVEIENEREFFESDPPIADLLVTSAEVGSAWTLIYPEFAVVIPEGLEVRLPLHYYVTDRGVFREFINQWLELEETNGDIERLRDYWILGIDDSEPEPRWSVIRNVLGWVD